MPLFTPHFCFSAPKQRILCYKRFIAADGIVSFISLYSGEPFLQWATKGVFYGGESEKVCLPELRAGSGTPFRLR